MELLHIGACNLAAKIKVTCLKLWGMLENSSLLLVVFERISQHLMDFIG